MYSKKNITRSLSLLAALIVILIPIRVSAAGTVNFTDTGDPVRNRQALNKLIEDDSVKTVNLPAGTLRINTFLRPGSNTTINAQGCTIIITEADKGAITNIPKRTNYSAITNLTVNGGTWKVQGNNKKCQSIVRLAHGSNITFNNVTILDGYEDHAVELVACKNARFNNCVFKAEGSCPAKCLEEQLQIDVADRYTAPGILREAGAAFVNGAPCVNISVNGCTISGGRGVCANYATRNAANRKARNYHSGITIKNSRISGKTSEAVALFNTKTASVTKSTIITNARASRGAYSIGLHVAYMEGSGPKANAKNKITIKGNTVKGGRQAIQVISHNKSKFGTVTISSNRTYCRKGKSAAIKADKKNAKKVINTKNKKYKW